MQPPLYKDQLLLAHWWLSQTGSIVYQRYYAHIHYNSLCWAKPSALNLIMSWLVLPSYQSQMYAVFWLIHVASWIVCICASVTLYSLLTVCVHPQKEYIYPAGITVVIIALTFTSLYVHGLHILHGIGTCSQRADSWSAPPRWHHLLHKSHKCVRQWVQCM